MLYQWNIYIVATFFYFSLFCIGLIFLILFAAIQACFVPLGNKGVYFKGLFLHINMYTIAGIACILFGIINLAVVIRMRNALKAVPPEVKSDENDNGGFY